MRSRGGIGLALFLVLAFGSQVAAQSTEPTASGSATSKVEGRTDAQASTPGNTQEEMKATTEAQGEVKAEARPEAKLNAIRERAMAVTAKQREAVDQKLEALSAVVDKNVTTEGEATVAARLASDFGVETEAMVAEKNQLGIAWGELMIAHMVRSSAKAEVTVSDLCKLRAEGLGWAQIAHGVGLRIAALEKAVRAEARVASGLTKPDGRPARIESGARVSASTKTNVAAGKTKVGTGTTIDAGVSVGKDTR